MNTKLVKNKVFLLFNSLIVLFLVIEFSQAQTTVVTETGNPELETKVQQKFHQLANSITVYQQQGRDTFAEDAGIQALKAKIDAENLYVPVEKLELNLVQVNDNYEVSGFALQKINGNPVEFVEPIFLINPTVTIVSVRYVAAELSKAQVLAYASTPFENEIDSLVNRMQLFLASINEKDAESYKNYFSEIQEMSVLPVELKQTGFMSTIIENPVSFIQERVETHFKPSSEVEIRFSQAAFFKHPFKQNRYGFTARQEWISSEYSFDNFVFMYVDNTIEEMKIVSYHSQREPFQAGTFSTIVPSLFFVKAGLVKVTSSSDSLSNYNRIRFSINTSNSNVFSVEKLKSYLENQAIAITGLELDSENSQLVGNKLIVPYELKGNLSATQHISATLKINRMFGIRGLTQQVVLYLGKDTHIEIAAEPSPDVLPEYPLGDWAQDITFRSKPEDVKIVVSDNNDFPIAEISTHTSGQKLKLVDGNYHFYAYKEGYYPKKIEFKVEKGEDRMVAVRLNPIESLISRVNEKPIKSGYVRTKWKVIGIATVVAGFTYWYMLQQDTRPPRIPNPPGRPIGVPGS